MKVEAVFEGIIGEDNDSNHRVRKKRVYLINITLLIWFLRVLRALRG